MSSRSNRSLAIAALSAVALFAAASPGSPVRHVRADGAVTISMSANVFSPASTVVPAGTTVVWENDEDPNGIDVTHNVMADDYTSWSSAYVDPGGTFAFTFATPGTYHYLCDLHSRMEGTITVV